MPVRLQQLLVPADLLQRVQVRPVSYGDPRGHGHRLPGHQVRESLQSLFVLQLHLQQDNATCSHEEDAICL